MIILDTPEADRAFAIMNKNIRITFLLIALVQGIHSVEEYYGELWDVYPPAAFICGLISNDLEKGFVILDISLFVVLMLTWLTTFRKNSSPSPLLWLWSILEFINGVGHSVWAITERSYVPGLATAPVLLVLSIIMLKLLLKAEHKMQVKI